MAAGAQVTQLRYPSAGRDYYQKKIAEGKTTKEAIRALKQRISDVRLHPRGGRAAVKLDEANPRPLHRI